MEKLADVHVNLSFIALLEDGITLENFELVQILIQEAIQKRFQNCEIFVQISQSEATHIHFLNEDGEFVQTNNHNFWLNVISAIEFVLGEFRQDVYPYLN